MGKVCTKFRRILHIDTIWRRRCREEFGVCENLQDLETVGTSYREVYAKLLHPHRHILGLWQLDTKGLKTLLYVAVDGLGITGWTYVPCLNTHVDGPMQFKPAFRIRLTETKSAVVECMEGRHRRPHCRHLRIRKDRLTSQCKKTDHLKDSPTRLREEFGTALFLDDTLRYHCRTYRRLYLPFHGKCARLKQITGITFHILQIHLTRRIETRGGEIFGDVDELSRVVREMGEQVLREQQQQQEDGTEDSEGHGGEMCFYGVETGTLDGSVWHSPGVVILFDENHLGFIDPEFKSFFLFGRVQNTFQNVEAASPQAFPEMIKNIHPDHVYHP
ncbi:F-box only protein 31-like [Myotis daubentonii]|uniref:F-box only protein 31-like n=1 Tax=Myotis daubentonii TaxID=98922 RepID=UPI0028736967|nr:F-box only protein 31-like [Myotis daubentonii]